LNSPWFKPTPGEASSGPLLICFPHAGGGGAAFRTWPAKLAGTARVLALHPPGRGARLAEDPLHSIGGSAEAIADALLPLTHEPYLFFGNSMGALVAFETARALRARGARLPAQLFVSARRGPRIAELDAPMAALDDAQFVAEVQKRYAAIPAEVAREPELMELLLPALRADFEALETYEYAAALPLDCAITTIAGETDARATLTLRTPWRDETSGPFHQETMPGGHFYFAAPAGEDSTLAWLAGRLAALRVAENVS
jgi:medium-chain acyl-[acyl-carrier-protein] hydrolase